MYNFINGRTRGILVVIHYIDPAPNSHRNIIGLCNGIFLSCVMSYKYLCVTSAPGELSGTRLTSKGTVGKPRPFYLPEDYLSCVFTCMISVDNKIWRGKERAWEKKKTCTYLTTWHIRILYDLKNKVFKDPTENGTDLNRILVSVHFGGTGH